MNFNFNFCLSLRNKTGEELEILENVTNSADVTLSDLGKIHKLIDIMVYWLDE